MGYGSPYNAGKAGIEAIAYGLAKEELKNNIKVNVQNYWIFIILNFKISFSLNTLITMK